MDGQRGLKLTNVIKVNDLKGKKKWTIELQMDGPSSSSSFNDVRWLSSFNLTTLDFMIQLYGASDVGDIVWMLDINFDVSDIYWMLVLDANAKR